MVVFVRAKIHSIATVELLTPDSDYPIVLTCWHLTFATIMTQIMARTTTLLDGRKTVKMTGRIYIRAILPIGAFFSLSLICGNMTYLYLGVAFIQMLKVRCVQAEVPIYLAYVYMTRPPLLLPS